jgi:predicted NAD/FAD-binding protein
MISSKIAIIGSGIAGLSSAYYLHQQHDVTVFEAAPRIGGHTATMDVTIGGRHFAVDTGFIVYNDWTYPEFIKLMQEIGVSNQPTDMSFALSDRNTGLEYSGTSLGTMFAQRRNLLSPRFLGMLRDIVRFNRQAPLHLDDGSADATLTLGEYLREHHYGQAFTDQYLVPMGSAIWSADTASMLDFPLQFFIRFFRNHGLLNLRDRPQWRVIKGGSRQYLQPLTQGFAHRIRTNTPIAAVRRLGTAVEIQPQNGAAEIFDHVIFACHSDQALALLQDPTIAEREILGSIPYQDNDVVLHTDVRMLPENRRTWSAWNYLLHDADQRAILTYNMNILQGLQAPETLCVTLNSTESINPHQILGKFNYSHPVFTLPGMRAQQRWAEINGERSWFCGAYWHNGFHEDGVTSALRVSDAIKALPNGETLRSVGSAA